MTTTVSNFQPARRTSTPTTSMRMMTSCSPPSLGFSSVLYSPTMNDDPSDEILNGDKRSAHNALERQRREGLNNKFQQLAHVLPGLQNVRRPSKSMIVAKSLEFVSKSVQRDSSYQNKIKQLRKEYQTLRKHTQQQQHLYKNNNKKIPTPPLLTTTTTTKSNNKKRTTHHRQEPTSPSKRQKQSTSPTPAPQQVTKKPTSPIRHKFVHHHASASSSSFSPEKKSCPATTTPSPPPPPPPQPSHYSTTMTSVPPLLHEFAIQPSWPPLDLSGASSSFLDHPQQASLYTTPPTLPFFTTDTSTAYPASSSSFYSTDPSYTYFWK